MLTNYINAWYTKINRRCAAMELWVRQYFLAMAREQTIFGAAEDLYDRLLIISWQKKESDTLAVWLKRDLVKLNVVATHSLLYNTSLRVEEGIYNALCLNYIINTTGKINLCFRPLTHKPDIGLNIVWKNYQLLTRAAEKFLAELRKLVWTVIFYNWQAKISACQLLLGWVYLSFFCNFSIVIRFSKFSSSWSWILRIISTWSKRYFVLYWCGKMGSGIKNCFVYSIYKFFWKFFVNNLLNIKLYRFKK